MGEVTGVDRVRRVVTVRETGEFGYDYLILATGAAYSWFGHDEWAAHATVLKSLQDAETIRLRLLSAFNSEKVKGSGSKATARAVKRALNMSLSSLKSDVDSYASSHSRF